MTHPPIWRLVNRRLALEDGEHPAPLAHVGAVLERQDHGLQELDARRTHQDHWAQDRLVFWGKGPWVAGPKMSVKDKRKKT